MMRLLLLLIAFAAAANAQPKWSEFRSDGFVLFTSAGAKPGRETLFRLEQFRHATSKVLGVDEARMPMPTRVLLFPQHANAGSIERGRDRVTIILTPPGATTAAFQRELARWLIDTSSDRIPADLEDGVLDLLSGLTIDGLKITAGGAPPSPSAAFPLIRYLATTEEYATRLPLLLRNLGRGIDDSAAWRNTLQKTRAQIEAEAVAAAPAMLPISARPLSPGQWSERPVDPERANAMLAEFHQDRERVEQYRAILAQPHTEASLKKAIELEPSQPAAYIAIAALEENPQARINYLRIATTLGRRDHAAWAALARAYESAAIWGDAARTWRIAEQAAIDPAVRTRMRESRVALEVKRLDWEEAERRKVAEAKEREIRKLKDAEVARIRELEKKYSSADPAKPGDKVVAWDDLDKAPPKITGVLKQVDCVGDRARLVIETPDKKVVKILIPDPSKIAVAGGAHASFSCGPQRPRKIAVEYTPRRDTRASTEGDAVTIEFP